MKALRVEDNKLKLADSAVPRREGEALVRMTMAGICSTDLEIARGYADFRGTLGHEFVGVVEESPDRSQIGRRVVGDLSGDSSTDRKSTRLNSSHLGISYAVFCLKKKKKTKQEIKLSKEHDTT